MGANTNHKANLKEIGRNAHKNMYFAEEVKIKRRHAVIIGDTREKIHENELAISFPAIARLLIGLSFGLCPTFDDDDCWGAAASNG